MVIKMYFNFTLCLFMLLAISFLVKAQDDRKAPTVVKSTDKVKIDGKYYYLHIVKPGENLFTISKAYNVSQIEIAMENPDIYLGVQVDQAIKIPIKKDELIDNEEDAYIYHIVRRRENISSLSRDYKISKQEIFAANPGLTEDIKINQIVLIPKKRISTIGALGQIDTSKYYMHEIKPREGFYALKRQYGVSEEIVRLHNPELGADGLKLGSFIKIPKNPNDTQIEIKPKTDVVFEKKQEPINIEKIIPGFVCDTFAYDKNKNVFNVALMLPFTQASEVQIDSSLIEDIGQVVATPSNQGSKRMPQSTTNFLDFYQGVLLAIDSLKAMGVSINLNVFNTERNVETTRKFTLNPDLRDAHLIIGPAYSDCIAPIAQFALENRIPIVSPLSNDNSVLKMNPYLFQVNPSSNTLLEEFAKQIDLCAGQNIVLIYEADSTVIKDVNYFKKLIDQRIDDCHLSTQIHFKEVSYHPGIPSHQVIDRVSQSLVNDKENLILVPSNNEVFVSDLLGNLHTLSTIHKFPISVYGFPRWQRFRNVQIDYFYQLQLNLFMPFYVDYGKADIKNFVVKYRDAFRAEPSQFAFQGYDVMFYFLTAMKNFGVDFKFCLPHHNNKLLQSKYNFIQQSPIIGFENRSVYIIRYTKNYEVIEVNKPNKEQVVIPSIYLNEPQQDRKEAIKYR